MLNWVPYICKDHPIEEVRLVDKEPAADENLGWVWEPGFRFDRVDQVPFFIPKYGKWKAKFIGGLMVYPFAEYFDAIQALEIATALWGHEAALNCPNGWNYELP